MVITLYLLLIIGVRMKTEIKMSESNQQKLHVLWCSTGSTASVYPSLVSNITCEQIASWLLYPEISKPQAGMHRVTKKHHMGHPGRNILTEETRIERFELCSILLQIFSSRSDIKNLVKQFRCLPAASYFRVEMNLMS